MKNWSFYTFCVMLMCVHALVHACSVYVLMYMFMYVINKCVCVCVFHDSACIQLTELSPQPSFQGSLVSGLHFWALPGYWSHPCALPGSWHKVLSATYPWWWQKLPLCMYWGSNLDLWNEQQVILTAELSLQPISEIFIPFASSQYHKPAMVFLDHLILILWQFLRDMTTFTVLSQHCSHQETVTVFPPGLILPKRSYYLLVFTFFYLL